MYLAYARWHTWRQGLTTTLVPEPVILVVLCDLCTCSLSIFEVLVKIGVGTGMR